MHCCVSTHSDWLRSDISRGDALQNLLVGQLDHGSCKGSLLRKLLFKACELSEKLCLLKELAGHLGLFGPCSTTATLKGRWGNDKNTSRLLHPTTSWLVNHYRNKVINKPPCQLKSSLFYIGAHGHAQHCFAMWVQTAWKWHASTIVLSVSVSLRLTLVVLELLCSMLYAGHLCPANCFVLIVLDSFFLRFSFICLTPKRQLRSMSVALSCISPPQRLLVCMGRSAEQVGEVAAVWAKHGGSTHTHIPPTSL